jgi:hypothetical protein
MRCIQQKISATLALVGLLCSPASVLKAQDFDPRDISGVWGELPTGRPGFNYNMRTPPPKLTDWGMENLRMMEGITHAAVGDPTATETINGVPTLTLGGQYPGKDCEPVGMPGNLDYVDFGPVEFIYTKDGDRIIQMLEYHREWRTFWFQDQHPDDIFPTYMGDSIASWDGDTLVVDTIGFNGLTQITQGVGHRPSDVFHLVERYTRISYDRLQLEMTMYDDKAWGPGASWSGITKTFALMEGERLQEFICVPSEYAEFDGVLEDAAQ